MHLFLIVISECAFTIWKLHCKRLLETCPEPTETTISPQEARNQTISIINSHLEQDRILSSKKRYSKSSLPEKLVLKTWSSTLLNKHCLPENWLQVLRSSLGLLLVLQVMRT